MSSARPVTDVVLPTLYQQYIHASKYARWDEGKKRRESWPETVRRYVEFMCFYVNEHHNAGITDDEQVEIEAAILSTHVLPSMRGLMTAGRALARDHMALYNPVAGDEVVLTYEYGLVPIASLVGSSCRVLNKDGRWAQATFRGHGRQKLWNVVVRASHSGSARTRVVRCSGNHRWYKTNGEVVSTEELKTGDRLPFAAASRPTIDDDYRLGVIHGLVYGDGSQSAACQRVHGYKIRVCADHDDLMPWFAGYPTCYPPSAKGDPIITMHDDFAKTHALKSLPPDNETDSYLLGFVRGWMAADGYVAKSGEASITMSREGVDWFRKNAVRLGFVPSRCTQLPSETNYGIRTRDTFSLFLRKQSLVNEDFLIARKRERFRVTKSTCFEVLAVSPSNDEEDVFCAEVPDTNTFVLDGGLVTGNCTFEGIDRPQAFDEMLYILMCGTGAGFSVERQFVEQLPVVADTMTDSDTVITVADSKIGWAKGLRELIALLYSGQVPKWDLTKLRPAGAILKTMGGRSSGPEPLDRLFRFTVSVFRKAAGRRLTPIECHDLCCMIGEIVVVGGVRRSALISLSDLEDDAMRHAKSGKWWETNAQRALSNNSAIYEGRPDQITFMREWLALVESQSGERGIINRKSFRDKCKEIGRNPDHQWGVNPCIVADTWIMTADGARQVHELINKPFTAMVNGRGYAATGFWKTGTKPVFKVKTIRGQELRATGNHEVLLTDGRWVAVDKLVPGNKIVLNDNRQTQWAAGDRTSFDRGWLLGEMVGDGGFNPDSSYYAYVRFWGETKQFMAERATAIAKTLIDYRAPKPVDKPQRVNEHHDTITVQCKALEIIASQYLDGKTKAIKPELERADRAFVAGFLSGYFDADGSIQGNRTKGRSIRLTSVHLDKLQAVQRMLMRLGVLSTIYTDRKDARREFLPDGRGGENIYECQSLHDLVITRTSMRIFADVVGFCDPHKAAKLDELLAPSKRELYQDKFETEVVSVESDGIEDVYDCTVADVHRFDANGLIIHNCAEIVLRSQQACNLSEVVIRQTDTTESLTKKVRIATILGTIQACFTNFRYVGAKWRRNIEEERLLGVSFTGIMDNALLSGQAGMEALTMALKTLRQVARDTNREWANRLGIPPSAAITCVKPSGTVSQLTDSASGIHPRYASHYIRRVRGNKTDPLVRFMMEKEFPFEHINRDPSNPTVAFEFPIASPGHAVLRNHLTAIQQLEVTLAYRTHWCDHNPSATIYVRNDEWLGVGDWVYRHFDRIGGVSFLPYGDDEHIYDLAPYEEVSKEKYEQLASRMPKSIDWEELSRYESNDMTTSTRELACVAGACELI